MARLARLAQRSRPLPRRGLSAAAYRKQALRCENQRVWPQARHAGRDDGADAGDPRPGARFARRASASREVAIIGGGIASALLSLALLHRGWQVTLYCADPAPANGASGNRQGALYPLLSTHDPALFQFFPAAFTLARRVYDTLPVAFDHDWCGVTQLGWDEKSQQKSRRCCRWGCRKRLPAR